MKVIYSDGKNMLNFCVHVFYNLVIETVSSPIDIILCLFWSSVGIWHKFKRHFALLLTRIQLFFLFTIWPKLLLSKKCWVETWNGNLIITEFEWSLSPYNFFFFLFFWFKNWIQFNEVVDISFTQSIINFLDRLIGLFEHEASRHWYRW